MNFGMYFGMNSGMYSGENTEENSPMISAMSFWSPLAVGVKRSWVTRDRKSFIRHYHPLQRNRHRRH
jgi:hypothetical protein